MKQVDIEKLILENGFKLEDKQGHITYEFGTGDIYRISQLLFKKMNYTRCSTELPVDKLQDLIDETYTWQVQDLEADTFEESLKLGIREGALAVKHYIDDKIKAIT